MNKKTRQEYETPSAAKSRKEREEIDRLTREFIRGGGRIRKFADNFKRESSRVGHGRAAF